MTRLRRVLAVSVLFAAALLPAAPAHAGTDFGVRTGYYFDTEEAFLGAELLTRLAPRWYFNPNVEWVFVDEGHLLTFNGDVHYDIAHGRKTDFWLGAGLAIINRDFEGPENGETDAGLNLFGGVGWHTGGIRPYVQAKFILHDDSEFVLAFGLRF